MVSVTLTTVKIKTFKEENIITYVYASLFSVIQLETYFQGIMDQQNGVPYPLQVVRALIVIIIVVCLIEGNKT